MQIYILEGQEQQGPFTVEELRQLVQRGGCSPESLAWHEELADWIPLSALLNEHKESGQNQAVAGLQPVAGPPPLPNAHIAAQREWYDHSMVIFPAAICCFPIGLLPLWLSRRFDTKTKIGLSAALGLGLVFYFGAFVTLLPSPGSEYSAAEPVHRGRSSKSETSKSFTAQHQKFRLGDFSYAIGSCVVPASIGPRDLRTEPSSGASFVVVRYTILNETSRTKTVLSDDFTLRDVKGRQFRPAAKALTALMMDDQNKDFLLTELQPGIEREAVTAFEVPSDSIAYPMVLVVPEKGFGSKKVEVRVVPE